VPVEDLLLLVETIPVKKRGVVREHKLYKVYLLLDMNDLWKECKSRYNTDTEVNTTQHVK